PIRILKLPVTWLPSPWIVELLAFKCRIPEQRIVEFRTLRLPLSIAWRCSSAGISEKRRFARARSIGFVSVLLGTALIVVGSPENLVVYATSWMKKLCLRPK